MINDSLIKLAKISLVCVFLVVIAGSLVRTTGSGMGCPDWPKCFGYYIPPTNISELTFQSEREYKKGQIIIMAEKLKVAKQNFVSKKTYNENDWSNYTKHDYALFNPIQTWIEYINRLIGALTGIPILLLFIGSFLLWKQNKIIPLLSTLLLMVLLVVAWMGKVVVDGNLIPNQITLHMLGAILLIVLLLLIINKLIRLNTKDQNFKTTSKQIFLLLFVSAIISLVQIILGTKVREQIDFIDRKLGLDRNLWIDQLNHYFDFHRSFAWIVLILNTIIITKLYKEKIHLRYIYTILFLIIIEIIIGLVMSYFSIPKYMQPAHLIIALLLFSFQTNFLLRVNWSKSI